MGPASKKSNSPLSGGGGGGSEADYRRDRRKIPETGVGRLLGEYKPAESVFLIAFLYYSTVGRKQSHKLAETILLNCI